MNVGSTPYSEAPTIPETAFMLNLGYFAISCSNNLIFKFNLKIIFDQRLSAAIAPIIVFGSAAERGSVCFSFDLFFQKF